MESQSSQFTPLVPLIPVALLDDFSAFAEPAIPEGATVQVITIN